MIRGRTASQPCPVILALQLLTDILNGFAHSATPASETFLDISARFVGDPLVMKAFVVGQIACGLLNFALQLLGLAIDLVFVHRKPSSVWSSSRIGASAIISFQFQFPVSSFQFPVSGPPSHSPVSS